MNSDFPKTLVNSLVVNPVLTAPGLSQKKDISPGVSGCYEESKLKYVKDVFCVDQLKYMKDVFCVNQLSYVKPVTNSQHAVSKLPVGARLLESLGNSVCRSESVTHSKKGNTLPFWIWPNLTRSPAVMPMLTGTSTCWRHYISL